MLFKPLTRGPIPIQRVVVAVLANLGHAGFPYASCVGLASHFLATPFAAIARVFFAAFIAFGGATFVVLRLVARLRR